MAHSVAWDRDRIQQHAGVSAAWGLAAPSADRGGELARLAEFRTAFYRCLRARADELFELTDGAPRGAVVPDGGERPSISLPS